MVRQASRRGQISIHAPVKGATTPCARSHVAIPISIHAPVKGATASHITVFDAGGISIHAPVKGATWTNLYSEGYETFQSTLP